MEHGKILIHLPELRFSGPPVGFKGGEIRELDFESLSEIDSDWMRPGFIEKSRPFFYSNVAKVESISFSEDEYSAKLEKREISLEQGEADILICALSALTNKTFLPTDLSTHYFLWSSGEGRTRRIGPAGRNLICHNSEPIEVEREQVEQAASLAQRWIDAGGSREENLKLFEPFRTIAGNRMSYMLPWFGVVPIVVHLESMLAPQKAPNILRRMIASANELLPGEDPAYVSQVLKIAYKFRSQVLHGEPLRAVLSSDVLSGSFFEDFVSLFRKVSVATIEKNLSNSNESNVL